MHRRLVKDDKKGVEEALNETEFDQGVVARGQHFLVLGPSSGLSSDGWFSNIFKKCYFKREVLGNTVTTQERILAHKILFQPWIGVADASKLSSQDVEKLLSTDVS